MYNSAWILRERVFSKLGPGPLSKNVDISEPFMLSSSLAG
jgi:hypothetical protein